MHFLLSVRGIILRTAAFKCHSEKERRRRRMETCAWRGGGWRWQCQREQTSPPVWLADSSEQTGGERRRTSRALCVCVCVCLFRVCACTSKASSLLRDWHLSVDAWSRLFHAAAVCVCLSGVLSDAVPGQFSLRKSVIPTCIPLSVCYPHVICHSASILLRPSLKRALDLITASTLCICLLLYQMHLAPSVTSISAFLYALWKR